MMDGNLELHSEIDRETKFSFKIPVECVGSIDIVLAQPTRRVIGLQAGQSPFRLLVAEDNENNRTLLVRLLRDVGFEVQEAVNGQDAIEVWKKHHPHLIWMDMRMPVMDGYEATSHINTAPGGKDTVIIALTASAFEEDRKKIIEHGGHDFVRKPFRESEIFEMLEKHLDVKFMYEEKDVIREPQPDQGLSLEVLQSETAALSLEILTRLAESTELSDAAMIDQVIEDIRTENVQLADGLSELADNFAYDEILALVQKAQGTISRKQGQ